MNEEPPSTLLLALDQAGPRSALSHESAARLLGIELLDDDGVQHLTVPRNRSRLNLPEWLITRSDIGPSDIMTENGLRATGPARTVADLARVLGEAEALAAADSAVRQGLVCADELRLHLMRCRGRGASRVRWVGAHLDAKAGSVLESLLRAAIIAARLPAPLTQHHVLDEGGSEIARVDFCWPSARLIVEADGYAFHSTRDSYRSDRRRGNELTLLGWRLLRFTWEDVRDRPDHVVGVIRACLAESGDRAA